MIIEDKIEMRRINDIRPYIRNPRKNEETVRKLIKLIPKVGFNVPIVVDREGIIVKGHARYSAAIKLGMQEVPCIVTHASDEDIRIDRITDNKISEFSEWVNEEVLAEIEEINTDIDFSDLGFPVAKPEEISFEPVMQTGPAFNPANVPVGGTPVMPQAPSEIPAGAQVNTPVNAGINVGTDVSGALPNADRPVPKKYYKYICADCGHVMFIEEDKLKG